MDVKLSLGLAGCETYEEVITFLLPDLVALPAGAFEQPAAALTGQARARFLAGHKAFQAACGACHPGDERAPPPVAEGALAETAILRLIPPDPRYGARLAHRALPGAAAGVPAATRVAVTYRILPGHFPDGETYELRLPRFELTNLPAGPLAKSTAVSPRAAPSVIGYGLIAAIEARVLRAGADPEDRDGDGISGRTGQAAGPAGGAPGLGRFGWKDVTSGMVLATSKRRQFSTCICEYTSA